MEEPTKKQYARATDNGDFISISTCSGNHGVCAADPQGKHHLFASDVGEEQIGHAVLDALAHSRFLAFKDHPEWYDRDENKRRNDEQVAMLMSRYGYKQRSALFSSMELCTIELVGGIITIEPQNHIRPEVWEQRTPDLAKNLTIPVHKPPAEIGAALKEGFRRCRE